MKTVLIVIGAILLVLAVFAGTYINSEEQLFGLITETEKPYSDYAVPLFIGSIILFIVGAAIGSQEKGS